MTISKLLMVLAVASWAGLRINWLAALRRVGLDIECGDKHLYFVKYLELLQINLFFSFVRVHDLRTDRGQTKTKQKVTIMYRSRSGSLSSDCNAHLIATAIWYNYFLFPVHIEAVKINQAVVYFLTYKGVESIALYILLLVQVSKWKKKIIPLV